MLLQAENWIKGYNQIVADCRPQNPFSGNAGTVLILCNPDADALCAARIFSYILRADNVPYQLRPCGGMSKLITILESLNLYSASDTHNNSDDEESTANGYGYSNSNTVSNSAIRAIVLLNLGATKNLNSMLYSPRPITSNNRSNSTAGSDDTSQMEGDHDDNGEMFLPPLVSNLIKTFVLDSHRPYHLANVHAGTNIVLWNDYDHWHQDEGGIPSDGDGLSGDDEDTEEEEDDEDDSKSENGESSDEGEAELEDDDIEAEQRNANNATLKRNQDEGVDDDNDVSPMRSKRQRQENPDTPDTAKMTDDEESEREDLDDDDDEDEDEDDDDDDIESINNEETNVVQSIREQRELRRNKIRKYYDNGSFHSSPVSIMVYRLTTEQRHGSVGDLLWLACVGVTDAYIHNRIDLSGYLRLSIELQNQVRETYAESDLLLGNDDNNIHHINQRLNNSFFAEDLFSRNRGFDEDINPNQNMNLPMTQVGLSENGRILIQKDEFRFFLLRHVTLWDAIVLSSEVNTKMELWKNSGVKKLREMLAKMGLPLNQCQQPYAFMKPSLKRRLKLMILDHAEVSKHQIIS
jgi:hypothetical protein